MDRRPRGLFFDVATPSDHHTSESTSSTKLSVTKDTMTLHQKEHEGKDEEGGKRRRE